MQICCVLSVNVIIDAQLTAVADVLESCGAFYR